MSNPRILRIYLNDGLRQSAEAGQHNFLSHVTNTVKRAGYRVEFRPNSTAERLKSAHRQGFALFHMEEPTNDRGLTIRRVYSYPFWAIEPTNRRWDWKVARASFEQHAVPRNEADKFFRFWQTRLFTETAASARRDGFIYVGLQGRLLDHRSFQTCAPLDMLNAVLSRYPRRKVVAGLHPNEHYSPEEIDALERLEAANPNLSVELGGMERWLAGCDFTVTQNSSVAFFGYLFRKPAVLFGQSDFHHIAANVRDLGRDGAFERVEQMQSDYAGFLHWFWQEMSINAGRPNVDQRIANALRSAGWPL